MTGVRLFAGANTAQGFYSFYPLLARDDLQRVFILKGGPGTGKSTFMEEIAKSLAPVRVDRFHVLPIPNPWTPSTSPVGVTVIVAPPTS